MCLTFVGIAQALTPLVLCGYVCSKRESLVVTPKASFLSVGVIEPRIHAIVVIAQNGVASPIL